jgi:chromosomal replication initiation ATPase DnaA
MYFIKYFDHEEISLKGIGKLFGNRDHSTVIHSIEGIKRVIQTKEKPYFEWYKEIKTAL